MDLFLPALFSFTPLFSHTQTNIISDCYGGEREGRALRGCIKIPPPPTGTSARVLLLREEEKVNILLINTFTSFVKEACHPSADG